MLQAQIDDRTSPELLQKIALHFAGFPFEFTGYGAAARAYLHAFQAAGIDLSVENRARASQRHVDDPLVAECLSLPAGPHFTLSHSEPSDHPEHLGPFSELIALTTWESDRLPLRHIRSLNQLREVWVPSLYNLEHFQRQLSVPVFQLPHPVSVPAPEQPSSAEIDALCSLQASDFVFLSIATWQERKNLAGTIEAFFRAFPSEPNVKLVLKTSFRFVPSAKAVASIARHLQNLSPRLDAQAVLSRLRIIETPLPAGHVEALLRRANAYLSLHRGEGWCYPLFDAACAGKPVIATAYSGPMDYLCPEHHSLVRFDLVPIDRGDDPAGFPFTPEMRWADPDLYHAAELIESVFHRYGEACQRAEAAAGLLRQRYSYQAVGRQARLRLESLA